MRLTGCSVALALALTLACATPGPRRVEPLRIAELAGRGDPARRASLQLVLDGLEADAAGARERGRGLYERALQVDATNPYAYLALARHESEWGHPRAALGLLTQARTRLDAEQARSPRVAVHLDGLAGAGTRFRRAYSTVPSCIPARRCLLTGQFPATHGMPGMVGGVPLTAPSWGNMLSESREYLVEAPWMMLVPAGAIVLAVVALNLVGDGIAALSRRRARDLA